MDVNEITELKRQGLSIQAISATTGFDRKTIRKYLLEPTTAPAYPARPQAPSKLDPFKPYLQQRLDAGVWNARVLLRELHQQGYQGSYTILTDWLRPQREDAAGIAVRRFETPPGYQAQVDWGHLGYIESDAARRKLWGFVFTLGYSRMMMAEGAVDQRLGTLFRMHERAFEEMGGVPEEILYDRMKTVWQGSDERGEIIWNPAFLDFARYWGFRPRLCRPYRAKTKGKVESGVKYVRRNFLCGLKGREPGNLEDFNTALRQWVGEVANQRVHGTTHVQVIARWHEERTNLQPLNGRAAYPYVDQQERKVATDAFVNWDASRYSVPWPYAGKQTSVRAQHDGSVEIRCEDQCIARHTPAPHKHSVISIADHHAGIPMGSTRQGKTLVYLCEAAPVVEVRSLAAYESIAGGDHDLD